MVFEQVTDSNHPTSTQRTPPLILYHVAVLLALSLLPLPTLALCPHVPVCPLPFPSRLTVGTMGLRSLRTLHLLSPQLSQSHAGVSATLHHLLLARVLSLTLIPLLDFMLGAIPSSSASPLPLPSMALLPRLSLKCLCCPQLLLWPFPHHSLLLLS